MAKVYATESANRACYNALQMLGGYGYTKDFPIERYARDARITTIYEGTSEIQRLIISRRDPSRPFGLNRTEEPMSKNKQITLQQAAEIVKNGSSLTFPASPSGGGPLPSSTNSSASSAATCT